MENFSETIDQKWVEFSHLPGMDYQVLSDDELVRECAERPCPEAWAEFIRRVHPLIASVVMRGCRQWSDTRPEVIEDLIQQTYLKLCANL